jgi:hypothetical protein
VLGDLACALGRETYCVICAASTVGRTALALVLWLVRQDFDSGLSPPRDRHGGCTLFTWLALAMLVGLIAQLGLLAALGRAGSCRTRRE